MFYQPLDVLLQSGFTLQSSLKSSLVDTDFSAFNCI